MKMWFKHTIKIWEKRLDVSEASKTEIEENKIKPRKVKVVSAFRSSRTSSKSWQNRVNHGVKSHSKWTQATIANNTVLLLVGPACTMSKNFTLANWEDKQKSVKEGRVTAGTVKKARVKGQCPTVLPRARQMKPEFALRHFVAASVAFLLLLLRVLATTEAIGSPRLRGVLLERW